MIKKFLHKKRRGAGLILALLITLIGGATIAMIFGTAGSFLSTSAKQSRVYSDGITAESFIEDAKGKVITANIAIATENLPGWHVLHGAANTSEDFNAGSEITDLAGLEVNVPSLVPSTVVENRKVEVKVFDALYKSARISSTFDLTNLHPSFFIGSGLALGGMDDEGELGEIVKYREAEKEIYRKYGVYVVQVKIFNEGGKLVRTTEEAFSHRVP